MLVRYLGLRGIPPVPYPSEESGNTTTPYPSKESGSTTTPDPSEESGSTITPDAVARRCILGAKQPDNAL